MMCTRVYIANKLIMKTPNTPNMVEPLYCGQHWDKYKCPEYRGVLISGVNLYYKAQFGTFVIQGCPQ